MRPAVRWRENRPKVRRCQVGAYQSPRPIAEWSGARNLDRERRGEQATRQRAFAVLRLITNSNFVERAGFPSSDTMCYVSTGAGYQGQPAAAWSRC